MYTQPLLLYQQRVALFFPSSYIGHFFRADKPIGFMDRATILFHLLAALGRFNNCKMDYRCNCFNCTSYSCHYFLFQHFIVQVCGNSFS